MKLKFSQKLAILAVFSALTAVFYPIPFAFAIPLLVASILFDFSIAIILSALMGCISLLFSLIGGTPLSAAFVQYPYVAIVPRLLIGPAVRGVFLLLQRLCRSGKNEFVRTTIPAAIAACIGSLVNTAGVLGFFALVAGDATVLGSAMPALLATWGVSGVIEAAICLVVCPVIVFACQKIIKRTSLGRSK